MKRIDEIREKAAWIGPNWKSLAAYTIPLPMAFRKDFYILEDAKSGVFKISAFYKYILYINGKTVAYGPMRSYPFHMFYDEVDVKPYLKKGRNSIGVVVFPSSQTDYTPTANIAFIIDGIVRTETETVDIFTDKDWKYQSATWYNMGDYLLSLPTYYQEHFNANEEEKNWKTAKKLDWENAFYIGYKIAPPFKRLEKRTIPYLNEEKINGTLIWVGNGKREIKYNENLAATFNDECLSGGKTEKKEKLNNEKYNIFTFDFGKSRLIRPGIKTKTNGDIRFELYYDIKFEEKPSSMRGFKREDEGFCDTFIPKNGTDLWEAAIPKGLRFLTIKICGSGEAEFKLNCKGIEYPYGEMRKPDTEDKVLNKIWEMAAESIKSCTNDAVVDTCTRENVVWAFDASLTCQAAFYTFGETKMWRRVLSLISEGIENDGIPRAVVPSQDVMSVMYDQILFCTSSFWEYYKLTKDKEFLKEITPKIYAFLNHCKDYITPKKLFVPPAFSRNHIDWTPLDKRPYCLTINLLFLLAAEDGAKIAKAMDNKEFLTLCKEISRTLREGVKIFYDEKKGAFVDHVEPEKEYLYNSFGMVNPDKLKDKSSIHGNSLAISAGICDDEMKKSVLCYMANKLKEGTNEVMFPGWVEKALSPLFENGYEKEAVEFIKRAYGEYIEAKAPTLGEGFGGGEFNTAHGWGSCVNILMAKYMGIEE